MPNRRISQRRLTRRRTQTFPPQLKTGLMFLPAVLILDLLIMFLEDEILVILFFVRWLMYPIAGFVAARMYHETALYNRRHKVTKNFVPNAAAAGLIVSIMSWTLFLLGLLIVTIVGKEMDLPVFFIGLLFAVIDIAVSLMLGALGGFFYSRS